MTAIEFMKTPRNPAAHGWTVVSPADAGFDADKLQAAINAFAAAAPHDKVDKLVIAHDGRLIFAGPLAHVAQGAWSITKTFVGTAMGLLYDDGKFQLDQPVADVLPQLKAVFPAATFRQFLSMTSGYQAAGDDMPIFQYRHGPSRTPFFPADKAQSAPGTMFSYWDSAPTMLALAGTVLAGESLDVMMRRRLTDPMGITIEWGAFLYDGLRINGGSGNHYGPVQISPLDLARFGELFRNQGTWDGSQLLSKDWCRMATSVQVPADLGFFESRFKGRGAFGFMWWVQGRGPEGELKWSGLDTEIFSAAGLNNNDLFVLPAHKLTVVRMGHDEEQAFTITDEMYAELLRGVVAAAA